MAATRNDVERRIRSLLRKLPVIGKRSEYLLEISAIFTGKRNLPYNLSETYSKYILPTCMNKLNTDDNLWISSVSRLLVLNVLKC